VGDHVAVGARIEHALGRRLDAAGLEAARALLAAAVADDGALAPILAAGGSLAGLEAAEAAGLVVLEPGQVAFRHPLVRSVVLARTDPAERRAAHRAYAAALGSGDRHAWHAAAGALAPDEAIAAALEGTGERAAGRGGHAAAASAFEQAARLTPDPEPQARRLHRAAESAWLGGDGPRALALLDEAEPSTAAEHLRGRVLVRRGPVPEAIRVLRTGAGTAEPARAAEMLAEAAYAAVYTSAGQDMDELARLALELAPADEPKARCVALIALGAARAIRGDPTASAPLEQAAELIAGTPELRDDLALATWLGVAPAYLRAPDSAYEPLVRSIALAREQGAVGVLPVALFYLGAGRFAAGRWREAAAHFTEGARLAEEAGLRADAAASLAGLARLEARRGNATGSGAAVERAREAVLPFFESWALHAQGEAALVAGDAAGALEAFEAKQRLLEDEHLSDPDLSSEPELAETLVHLGRAAEARAVAERALGGALAKGRPWAVARAQRAMALTDAIPFSDFEDPGDAFETARTKLCHGEALRREGRRRDARTPLREALAAFDSLGATPWTARAVAELRATGEVVRRRDPATLDELTPQELRVASMLAGGATTREAGAALYLSPKTVEYHLRHVYSKLGINSRAALASALATDVPRARC
jgi:DNA-binding CsgD family transcriptional regulator